MHFSTLLIPFALALSAVSEPIEASKALPEGLEYARQFRREHSKLAARLDVDPDLVCGSGFDDCGNGWCCSKGRTCAGTLESIPVCKAPDFTLGPLQGTAVATPFKDLEQVAASLSAALSQLTEGALPGGGDVQTTQAGGSQNTGQPANGKQTDGAVALSVQGGFGAAAAVMGVWGAAMLGGAGWLLM